MKRLAFGIALLVFCSVSHACLNDRDTLIAEQEFRSSYLLKSHTQLSSAAASYGTYEVIGGLVLFSAAMGMLAVKKRRMRMALQ